MPKPIIEQGDVIAIMGKGWISGLIASFTGPVSHVGIVTNYGSDPDHILVTQALSIVRTLTLAETMATAKYGYAIHCNDLSTDDRLKAATFALSHIGEKYAYRNIFFQALKQITGNPKWTEHYDDNPGQEIICSELVAACYAQIGRDFGVPVKDCDPSDIIHYAMPLDNWLVQPLQ